MAYVTFDSANAGYDNGRSGVNSDSRIRARRLAAQRQFVLSVAVLCGFCVGSLIVMFS